MEGNGRLALLVAVGRVSRSGQDTPARPGKVMAGRSSASQVLAVI